MSLKIAEDIVKETERHLLFILIYSADLEAARSSIAAVDRSEIPNARQFLKQGWFFPLPFAVLIGGLFWLNYSPEFAALVAALVMIVCSLALVTKGNGLGCVIYTKFLAVPDYWYWTSL